MTASHILLTTDFSDESFKAIGPTLALAKKLGAKITVLHAVPQAAGIPYGAPLAPPLDEPDVSERVAEAEKQLEAIRGRFGSDVDVDLVVEAGPSVEEVVTGYAEKHGASFIAMSSHGRSGLRRLVMGSVAEAIVRHSKTPVIVFPLAAKQA